MKPQTGRFASGKTRLGAWFVRRHRAFTTILFFAVLLVPLSSSVNLTGQLGFVQKKIPIDTLEGGKIAEILVVDGQFVQEGEVLARLEEPRLNAEMVSLLNAAAAKACRLARYQAALDLSNFRAPQNYALLPQSYLSTYCIQESIIAQDMVSNQKRKNEMLRKQIFQAESDLLHVERSLQEETRRVEIQEYLYKQKQQLVAENFFSRSALLDQESQLINAKQSLSSKVIDISDKRNRVVELKRQQIEMDADFFDRNRSERAALMTDFESQYASLGISLRANTNLTLTAPQAGHVYKLKKARPGLLLAPRETLLELVPQDDDLVVIANYRPLDHANVQVGQEATVRLLTHSQSFSPEFRGKVLAISPDVKQESAMEPPSYEATVSFPCDPACRKQNQLTAGIPTEVYVLGPKRSLFSYLINALYRTGANALSEPN